MAARKRLAKLYRKDPDPLPDVAERRLAAISPRRNVVNSDHEDARNSSSQQQDAVLDSSFDTSFDFAAAERSTPERNSEQKPEKQKSPTNKQAEVRAHPKPPQPRASKAGRHSRLKIIVEERISILFDNVSAVPSCQVTGSIYMRPATLPSDIIHVLVHDKKGNIERSETFGNACSNVTSTVNKPNLEPNTQVLRIIQQIKEDLEAPVFCYKCLPRVRPIPFLLKTRVQRVDDLLRVGVRIRANPGNKSRLKSFTIIMVVPPDAVGETVSMSMDGGVWDQMKRTISWAVNSVNAGETVEIRAQFESIVPSQSTISKFPVLIKCEGDSIPSGVTISADSTDQNSSIFVDVVETSNILYRKVD